MMYLRRFAYLWLVSVRSDVGQCVFTRIQCDLEPIALYNLDLFF